MESLYHPKGFLFESATNMLHRPFKGGFHLTVFYASICLKRILSAVNWSLFITLSLSTRQFRRYWIRIYVLSFVDQEKAFADAAEVGSQWWILVPAVTHQLQQLSIIGPVIRWDWRTKRRCLSTAHTHEDICPQQSVHNTIICTKSAAARFCSKNRIVCLAIIFRLRQHLLLIGSLYASWKPALLWNDVTFVIF